MTDLHDSVAAVMTGADAIRSWQEDFYRDLHQHPELSHQEHRTAAAVEKLHGDARFGKNRGQCARRFI